MNRPLQQLYTIAWCMSIMNMSANFSDWLPSYFRQKYTESITQELKLPTHGKVVYQHQRGAITIETWNKPTGMLYIQKEALSPETVGKIKVQQKKIDGQLNLTVEQPGHDTIVTTRLVLPAGTNAEITVTECGDITATNSSRSCSLSTKSGAITITTTKIGNIEARSEEGSIIVTGDEFGSTSSLLLTALQGGVFLTLPASINARLDAKTQRAAITSDILVTLDPLTLLLTKQGWKEAMLHIQGILGEGGGPITIDALGKVVITPQAVG